MKQAYILMVLGLGVALGGCAIGPAKQTQDMVAESPIKTLTGTITIAGKTVNISKGGVVTEITSRRVDLTQYNGKEVSVTGQFSGSTLYVDEIQ